VWGERPGNIKRRRTNLIMGWRRREYVAPQLFTTRCTARVVEDWLVNHLFPTLTIKSLLVLDNAPFHRKTTLRELAQHHGHELLFLPPYSPDFNPIEKSFGTMKRARSLNPSLTLEQLIEK